MYLRSTSKLKVYTGKRPNRIRHFQQFGCKGTSLETRCNDFTLRYHMIFSICFKYVCNSPNIYIELLICKCISQILMPARSRNSEKNKHAFNTIFASSISRLEVFAGSVQELHICRHAHIKFQIGCEFEILMLLYLHRIRR